MTANNLICGNLQVPCIEGPNDPLSEVTLQAIMASGPLTIAIRGLSGVADLQQVTSRLAVQEALMNMPDGYTKLWAVMGETPASIRSMTVAWPLLSRLSALVFSPARMLSDLKCASDTALEDWPDTLRMGRNLTVLMASDLKIPAYEWIAAEGDHRKAKALALRDGFSDVVTLKSPINRLEGV